MADNYWPLVVLLSLCFMGALLVGGLGLFLLFRGEFLPLVAERWVRFKVMRGIQATHYREIQVRLQEWGITILRVGTGIVFLISGGQKLFGGGFGETVKALGELHSVSLPLVLATAVTLVEFLGGVALILGLLTRLVSILLVIVMVADILSFHPPRGFFVEDTGYEYALLRLAACVALVVAGPAKAALSSILTSQLKAILPRLLR